MLQSQAQSPSDTIGSGGRRSSSSIDSRRGSPVFRSLSSPTGNDGGAFGSGGSGSGSGSGSRNGIDDDDHDAGGGNGGSNRGRRSPSASSPSPV